MLFYHGRGSRDYVASPHGVKRRQHWELATILSGYAAPAIPGCTPYDDRPALWIFPPRHGHGWRGRPGSSCTVSVFHVASVPQLVAQVVETHGHLRIPLTVKERKAVARLDRDIATLLEQRGDAGEIAADLVRGHLGALTLPHLPKITINNSQSGEKIVKRCFVWLEEHLHLGYGVNDAAKALAISPAHLRRLCHQIAGQSPRDLLNDLRLKRACTLLSEDGRNLRSIAWDCGYSSDVALSQAFLKRYGMRPGSWRKHQAMG